MSPLEQHMEFAKLQKIQSDGDDMHPHVIVEKDNNVVAVVIAPSMEKSQILQAAFLCKLGFDPDSLTITFDAKIRNSEDESESHECLIAHRIERNKKVSLMVLPYVYDGNNVEWIEQGGAIITDNCDVIDGKVNAAIKKIMDDQPLTQQKEFYEMIEKSIDITKETPEKILFHTSRAVMAILISMKFKIVDLLSCQHPEWTEGKTRGKQFIDRMIADGIIKPDSKDKLHEVIDKHMGKATFSEVFEHYIVLFGFSGLDISSSTFAKKFEAMCMSPQMNSDSDLEMDSE